MERQGFTVNPAAPGAFESEMADGVIQLVSDGFVKTFPQPCIGRMDQLDSSLLVPVSPSDFMTGARVKGDDGRSHGDSNR